MKGKTQLRAKEPWYQSTIGSKENSHENVICHMDYLERYRMALRSDLDDVAGGSLIAHELR
jgi:hypothetical protein